MNIFVLDSDPKLAAKYHCNKHVVKMILESGQMLCAAHWNSLLVSHNKKLSDFKNVKSSKEWLQKNTCSTKIPPYAFTHVNHPCTVWTSKNIQNYKWHLSLMRELLNEYSHRYKKLHKSESVWTWLNDNLPENIQNSESMTQFALAMPDDCKIPNDPVASYRKYYINYKQDIVKWEPHARMPSWFEVL
jgi:hypothetical protein